MSFWQRLFSGSRGLPAMPAPLDEAFVPDNDLERALLARDDEALHRLLPSARLFVPSRADASALDEGDPFQPILLDSGGPCIAALTSAGRLKGLLAAVPDVASGIDVEASWVLAHCPAGMGLALNPGWREGLIVPPEEIARLARQAG